MKPLIKEPSGGVTLKPCQGCDQLKAKFYLCDRGHSTCYDCEESRSEDVRQLAQRFERLKGRSPPSTDRLAPSEVSLSDDHLPSFAFRSPIRSLITSPVRSHTRRNPAPRAPPSSPVAGENRQSDPQIFCQACNGFVEVILVNLPTNVLKLVPQSSDFVEAKEDPAEAHEPCVDYSETLPEIRVAKTEPCGRRILKKDVNNLRDKLVTAYSELMTARRDLGETGQKTVKLGLDVDMLRGGVEFLYFNFDVLQKNREIWIEEKVCGIPFVIMVRLRRVSRVPHVGFFVGLNPSEGLAHSPLEKIIVFRAHNAYGKVIETQTLKTLENGEIAHPCFDLRKRPLNDGIWGYADFLKMDRVMKPDMLKNGILCLSLQVKMLQ